jgi:hypothetical protein
MAKHELVRGEAAKKALEDHEPEPVPGPERAGVCPVSKDRDRSADCLHGPGVKISAMSLLYKRPRTPSAPIAGFLYVHEADEDGNPLENCVVLVREERASFGERPKTIMNLGGQE